LSTPWTPPVALSPEEERIVARCKKAKLYVFLREHRHELLDETFQRELAAMYSERRRGDEPVPPALLAMATILQAYEDLSDEDAVDASVDSRRWQMLLGTLGRDEPAFSQGTLFNFRQRLIAHDLDRRLVERTVELARTTRGFSHKALRAAFDSSPLFGAARVEDTFNLIGHAVRDVLRTVAARLDVAFDEAARRAGVPLLSGEASLKAALDVDWDDPAQKKAALETLLAQVRDLGKFLERELSDALTVPPLREQWAVVEQFIGQDIEPDPEGGGSRIKAGVAKERRISVRDGEMRHGRKSKSSRVDGYKRHIAVDIDTSLIVAAAVTPANRPEGEASGDLLNDVERQGFSVEDLYNDRAYLLAEAVEARRFWDLRVHAKAFPLHNRGRYTKADFRLDFEAGTITCPAGTIVDLVRGAIARFPTSACGPCSLREHCTKAPARHLAIHREEPFLVELRAQQKTPTGRADLRKRVTVEHRLAAIGGARRRRARYVGVRKNLFDVRRHAAVANLHVAAAA
jgi:hypothetical protein